MSIYHIVIAALLILGMLYDQYLRKREKDQAKSNSLLKLEANQKSVPSYLLGSEYSFALTQIQTYYFNVNPFVHHGERAIYAEQLDPGGAIIQYRWVFGKERVYKRVLDHASSYERERCLNVFITSNSIAIKELIRKMEAEGLVRGYKVSEVNWISKEKNIEAFWETRPNGDLELQLIPVK